MGSVKLTVFFHKETDGAYLISDDGENTHWIPKSQCVEIGEPQLVGEHPEIELTIPVWLAQDQELI